MRKDRILGQMIEIDLPEGICAFLLEEKGYEVVTASQWEGRGWICVKRKVLISFFLDENMPGFEWFWRPSL